MDQLDSSLIEAIYGTAVHEGNWRPALELMRLTFNSAEASLTYFDPWPTAVRQETSGHVYTQAFRDRYSHYYGRLDPKRSAVVTGIVFNDARHFDRSFVARDPFYQEFTFSVGLRHTLCINCVKQGRQEIALAAVRNAKQGPYDVAAESRLALLAPHFARAVELKGQVDQVRMLAAGAGSALDQLSNGILIFDELGRVIFANASARATLNADGELKLRQARLTARSSAQNNALDAALQAAVSGNVAIPLLSVGNGKGGRIIVQCVSLPASSALASMQRPGAIVMLYDAGASQGPSAKDIAALYGLTDAEAQLALALCEGETLAQTAAARRVKLSTVRSQLLSTLQKMGLHRQVDLVRTLVSLKGTLKRP